MAYQAIIVRKLKYSYGGNDYDLTPVQIPHVVEIRGTDAGTPKNFEVWLANPSNAESSNSFNFQGADNTEDGRINKARLIESLNYAALDITPIFKSLSVGQDLIFWREDMGKSIAWVWRKENATEFRVGTLAYGTYTWGNKKSISPGTSYGRIEPDPLCYVGFLHDSQTDRFHWFFCRYYTSDAAHGYSSEPIYFQGSCDYYWNAYGQVIASLCTGNYYVPGNNYDPYADTGEPAEDQLQTGPATGDGDDTSDAISLPTLPTLNLSASHLLTAYVPDASDIDDLADFMWGNFDHTDVTKDLSKIFADPRDGIIALFMLPFEPDKSLVKQQAAIGAFPISGLEMYTLTSQFKHVSCGSVDVTEFYGNYLDFNPFCRLTLFLPFVGEVQLDPDEVMGKTVSVDYYVDCMTGAFVAFVTVPDKILAQYQGNCSTQIPTTAADYTAVNSALLTAATAAVGLAVTAVTGGSGAALMAGAGAAGSSAVGVMQSKVNHSHSGALGGAAGFMGSQTPYLLIHRARQSVPANANEFKGYPCNATFQLSDLRGYGFTKVHDIILDNFGYSDAEMSELRQILADGVFF